MKYIILIDQTFEQYSMKEIYENEKEGNWSRGLFLQQGMQTVSLIINLYLKSFAKADFMGLAEKESVSGRDKAFSIDIFVEGKLQLQSHSTCTAPMLFQRRLASPNTPELTTLPIIRNIQIKQYPRKQEFLHFSFLTPHASTTLIPLNLGLSPAVLDRQDFCTASIVSAGTSTMELWFLFSNLSFNKSIFCVNEQSRTRKNSPSAAKKSSVETAACKWGRLIWLPQQIQFALLTVNVITQVYQPYLQTELQTQAD